MFRPAVRGYDRLQVDNYVTWAETEVQTARRQVEELTSRYGSALAELEISRRLLAQSPTGREMTRISERIGQMLRLAADEAADLTASGAREAERLVSEARAEADAILRKARDVKEVAVAASDRMRNESRLMRAEAMTVLDRARREAAELIQAAGLERRRLDQQTEQARQIVRGVTAQIGAAIGALAADLQRDVRGTAQEVTLPHRFEGNTVVPVPAAERSSEPAGA
jgi:cell division septum initiation protein DivIVA